jgi:hypothetical protein
MADETKQIGVQDVIFKNADDYRSIYANNIQFGISFQDMSLIFGEIMGLQDGRVTVEHRVRVTMSPQQSKLLSILLNSNVLAYEQKFGEIKIPADSVQQTTEVK